MPELDELPAPRELKKLLRQVITANQPAVVHDQEGNPVAALVPWEMFALVRRRLTEPSPSPPVESLTPEEERRAREFAAAMRAKGVAANVDPNGPVANCLSDSDWQRRWDALLAEFRRDTEGLTPDEIEAEIERASEELRQERDTALAEVRQKIRLGLDQIQRGEVFDGEAVFDELDQEHGP